MVFFATAKKQTHTFVFCIEHKMLLKLAVNILVQAILETRKIKPMFMTETAVTKTV